MLPMKTTPKTIFSLLTASFVLAATGSPSLAQLEPTQKPLRPYILKILCERSPLNSRCPEGRTVSSTPTATTPKSGGVSENAPTVPVGPSGGGTAPLTSPQGEMLPGSSETTPSPKTEAPAAPDKASTDTSAGTVVEVASASSKLKTLTAALKAAGLDTVLSGKGPFTIFAPTDEAFAALPPEAVQELLKPENKARLAQLLTYHVVPGAVESKDLKPGEVATVQGKPITVKLDGSKVMVNDANVIQADIPASNGVIHLIDKVILPAG